MGYERANEPPRSRWREFLQWWLITFLWFPYAIGGWLVMFGMPALWMLGISVAVAFLMAWHLSRD